MNKLVVGLIFAVSVSCAHAKKEPTIFVFKSDGSKQCEAGGTSVEDMEKELVGVKVISRKKGNDGKMYAAVCGGKTGSINIYEIHEKDKDKALKLGFELKQTK